FLQENVEVPEISAPPIWDNPLVRDIARLLAGLVILLALLLFVVRPMVRSLTAPVKAAFTPPEPLPAPAAAAAAPSKPVETIAYEQRIAEAGGLVAKDPVRVAQVVKEWVEKDE